MRARAHTQVVHAHTHMYAHTEKHSRTHAHVRARTHTVGLSVCLSHPLPPPPSLRMKKLKVVNPWHRQLELKTSSDRPDLIRCVLVVQLCTHTHTHTEREREREREREGGRERDMGPERESA